MARELSDDKKAESEWSHMKVLCPICNKSFSSWYCPNCGLPKNNSSYHNYKGLTYYCGINHFRRDFGTVSEFQLCANCSTPNPYNTNFCRNCGKEMTLHAKDVNGHSWVDLGLSVLWSTHPIDGYFQWNNPRYFSSFHSSDLYDIREYKKSEKKDVATYMWGEKWRTPTKEEFEELIKNCTWKKLLYPQKNPFQYALKATGPNGNSIDIPMAEGLECTIWTSSSVLDKDCLAYTFRFKDWYNILYSIFNYDNELESIQKRFNEIFEFIKQVQNSTDFPILSEFPVVKNLKQVRDIVMRAKKREELRTSELWHFMHKEKERLWLETPPLLENDSIFNNIRQVPKWCAATIRPVADKKWQGKL